MHIVAPGDNLHEMSKPIYLGQIRKYQFVVCWISQESANG